MNRDEIAQLLPAVFERTLRKHDPLAAHRNTPLAALLEVMEVLQAPSEAVLAQLDATFDPRRTGDEFVPFLAYWADLTRLFDDNLNAKSRSGSGTLTISSGLGRLRELIANAAFLSQWRGTRKGLLLFLQTATGLGDFEIKENVGLDGSPRPFHISVLAPKGSAQFDHLIERIVELEKPAYVTHEISFEGGGAG